MCSFHASAVVLAKKNKKAKHDSKKAKNSTNSGGAASVSNLEAEIDWSDLGDIDSGEEDGVSENKRAQEDGGEDGYSKSERGCYPKETTG